METQLFKSISEYCLECRAGYLDEVELCPFGDECPLYELRLGKNPQHLTILGHIHARCIECAASRSMDVANCSYSGCALYLFRMGIAPTFNENEDAEIRLL